MYVFQDIYIQDGYKSKCNNFVESSFDEYEKDNDAVSTDDTERASKCVELEWDDSTLTFSG